MKDEHPLVSFFGGIVIGMAILAISQEAWPKVFRIYNDGVRAAQKEAFEHGLMTKEVDKDDKVIYRWIETRSGR